MVQGFRTAVLCQLDDVVFANPEDQVFWMLVAVDIKEGFLLNGQVRIVAFSWLNNYSQAAVVNPAPDNGLGKVVLVVDLVIIIIAGVGAVAIWVKDKVSLA